MTIIPGDTITFCEYDGCPNEANWRCTRHPDVYWCRTHKNCPRSEGTAYHRDCRQPLHHIAGSKNEIIPGLWLGDRFDAEEIGEDPSWKIVAIADYPHLEIPKEPKSATVCYIFANREHLEDCGYDVGFGSEWHESPELRVSEKVLTEIAVIIRNAMLDGKKVLVHCVGGIHRSPLVVAWFLYLFYGMKVEGYTVEDAYDLISKVRPQIQRRTYWLPDDVREKMFKPKLIPSNGFIDDGDEDYPGDDYS